LHFFLQSHLGPHFLQSSHEHFGSIGFFCTVADIRLDGISANPAKNNDKVLLFILLSVSLLNN
jgi:hypothetical protein